MSYCLRVPRQPRSTPFPYTTLFRSHADADQVAVRIEPGRQLVREETKEPLPAPCSLHVPADFARFSHIAHDQVLAACVFGDRSEEHTSELQSHSDLVCRLLLEKKKT